MAAILAPKSLLFQEHNRTSWRWGDSQKRLTQARGAKKHRGAVLGRNISVRMPLIGSGFAVAQVWRCLLESSSLLSPARRG
ncbi:MAG: hypothetical protein HZY78_05440 [Burkholderiaceae bacterium]|nr:MAG: hypothetical protein HZY78_05440 [Burkholderiaceae bacterium]